MVGSLYGRSKDTWKTGCTLRDSVDKWNRVFVLDRDLVKSPIVHTHSQFAVFLLDEQDRGSEGRSAWLYVSFVVSSSSSSGNIR